MRLKRYLKNSRAGYRECVYLFNSSELPPAGSDLTTQINFPVLIGRGVRKGAIDRGPLERHEIKPCSDPRLRDNPCSSFLLGLINENKIPQSKYWAPTDCFYELYRLMECQTLSNVLMEPLILTHSNQHTQDTSSSSLQGVTRNKHRVWETEA